MKRPMPSLLTAILLGLIFSPAAGCEKFGSSRPQAPVAVPELIKKHVELIGPPRVEKISEHVWAALSYDLANVGLIDTGDGLVIVDPGMSPARARLVKDAFAESDAPKGRVRAVILTHSHIDHIGGTSVFVEEGTEIWATDAFPPHMMKQYERFVTAETLRGRRQFGNDVSADNLPVHGLGPRVDIAATQQSGVRMPTKTFSGQTTLKFGSVSLELVEGHGETHDALFIWLPSDQTLIAGDNFYYAFPNLYTIRGTSPRPVDDWIASIDEMRRRQAEHLLPNHTKPIHGRDEILTALANYRDAIQWVRDETIRGANRGLDVDTLAETIKLPPHLAGLHYTTEYYGQVDWSVRAIYANNLGWFDGRAEELYKLPRRETADREIEMMGGPQKLLAEARKALADGDPKWAQSLLAKLSYSSHYPSRQAEVDELLIETYEKIAAGISNLNGRAYLLQTAYEIKNGIEPVRQVRLDPEMIVSIPLEMIFTILSSRLIPEKAMDVHESARFVFPDEKKQFILTVRRGIAEVSAGEPLPGTPEPGVTLTCNADTYKMIATGALSPAASLAKGDIKIEGGLVKFLTFMSRFDMKKND